MDQDLINLFQRDDLEIADQSYNRVDKEKATGQTLQRIRNKQLAERLYDLNDDDREEWLSYQKLKGNRLFKQKNYDRAIQVYQELCLGLDLTKHRFEYQVPALGNMALCFAHKKEYQKALKLHEMAIQLDPSPLRILRRAYLCLKIDDYETIRQDLAKLSEMEITKDLLHDYRNLKIALQEHDSLEKKLYKGMFKSFEHDSQEEDEIPGIKQGRITRIVSWFKDLGLRLFGCRKLFTDEDADIDPQKFLQS